MLRVTAKLISVLFHPLLILTYMLLLLIMVNPYLFGVSGLNEKASKLLILEVFLTTFFIPAVAMMMLKFLGLVESMEMKDRHERIGPYIMTGIFYLWLFRNFLGSNQVPDAYTSFVLGATIGLFIAFFINIFSKISAHAVGMGGLVGMVVITMFLFSYDTFSVNVTGLGAIQMTMVTILVITILLAGLVGTSRLFLKAHQPTELYGGYLVGLLGQLIALRILF